MSLCKFVCQLLYYPHANLRLKAEKIEEVDDNIKAFVDDMLETMYKFNGIGLAAIQVNVQKQVVVIDISEKHDQPLVFINPQILEKRGEQTYEEGCLSLPGIFVPVKRAAFVRVQALDRNGKNFELKAEGLLAVCIQHEVDHLYGKLIIDYLSRLKQHLALKKMKKLQKQRL